MTGGAPAAASARAGRRAIGLYYADTRNLSTAAIDRWLTEADRERLAASMRRLRRTQYLAGRALLRFALERWTGLPAAAHRLRVRDGGKPDCIEGPAISLSHDGSSVACAIAASGEIGIDLQHVEPRRRTEAIARQYFSHAENAWLESARPDAFYMLWVLKEAYLKALGSGLAGGLDSLDCRVEPPVIRASAAIPASLALYAIGDAYLGIAAIGCRAADTRIECWQPFRTFAASQPRLVATSASA